MEAKEKKEAEEFLFCYLDVPNFSYIYASIRIKISELILNIAFCFSRRNYSCTEDGTYLRTHCVPTFIFIYFFMFIIWVKTLRISLPLSNMIVGWIKYFNERKVLGIKGFCGTHGGSISIITFLLFNWGWSDKDDWRAKWRLKDEMTTEGRNDDWRAKWRLKDEMTTEGR